MTAVRASHLWYTMDRLTARSAEAVLARGRIASRGLNAALRERLGATPGAREALFADPVIEAARAWVPAEQTLGELSGDLLEPRLVAALDSAARERMPRDRKPYAHQFEAWEAAGQGRSVLVTSGTGSGKTECFLIPILNDLLRQPSPAGGVRAILLYPLNALIESQRERLSAWAEGLGGKVRFALYNGDTPETRRQGKAALRALSPCELGDRESIRKGPPEILVTNVTMLEYLLLRAQDQAILSKSKGLLRWIVLDEAHGYVGAQAAEMALLLRRVRGAFGVRPEDVRLMATSATIGDEEGGAEKLRRFLADLAGVGEEGVRVVEGRAVEAPLPPAGEDGPLDPAALAGLSPEELGAQLAPHPRVQKLVRQVSAGGASLGKAARLLWGDESRRADAQALLDLGAQARHEGRPLLRWRAHLFHRAQGGVWACIDPACPDRDEPLRRQDADWGFGAVYLGPRDRCGCGAPVFEIVACTECGRPHLVAGHTDGVAPRLVPVGDKETDDFAVDAEPEAEGAVPVGTGRVWLAPARQDGQDSWVRREDEALLDNPPEEGVPAIRLRAIHQEGERGCCGGAEEAALMPQRYGPAFFIGNALPLALEALSPALGGPNLPMGGRRAISFSDSRQGVARLAAKLQQDAERTLTRSFLYHAVQEGQTVDAEAVAALERSLARYRRAPDDWAEEIARTEAEIARLTGAAAAPIPWEKLIQRFAAQTDLQNFAGKVWSGRTRIAGDMADDPQKLAEMLLLRELIRRPRVQNNPETMGLLRLRYPVLEERARAMATPQPLREAGVDAEGWDGLALAAVDFAFRNYLAVNIEPWLVPLISPRFGTLNVVMPAGTPPEQRPGNNTKVWPGPVPMPGNPSRLHRMVYGLIGGGWDLRPNQERAETVLTALWSLLTSTVAKDIGQGCFRLDLSKAAVARLDQGFVCPVTRRVFGYTVHGGTPYDVAQPMRPLAFPRLPLANAGGSQRRGTRGGPHLGRTRSAGGGAARGGALDRPARPRGGLRALPARAGAFGAAPAPRAPVL